MGTFLLFAAGLPEDILSSHFVHRDKSSSKLYKSKDTTDTPKSAFIRKHCIDNKGFLYIRGDCNISVFHMECNTDITCDKWESAL